MCGKKWDQTNGQRMEKNNWMITITPYCANWIKICLDT